MMREDKLPSAASQGETDVKQISLLMPLAVVWALVGGTAAADPKPISQDAKVYIIWPPDGQVIPGGKFWVRMGLSGTRELRRRGSRRRTLAIITCWSIRIFRRLTKKSQMTRTIFITV